MRVGVAGIVPTAHYSDHHHRRDEEDAESTRVYIIHILRDSKAERN